MSVARGYEPGVEGSLVETLRRLRGEGYTDEFRLDGHDVVHAVHRVAASDLEVVEVHRFEGESNPDDEAIILALASRGSGWRGVLVSAYGPSITAEVAEFLAALPARAL